MPIGGKSAPKRFKGFAETYIEGATILFLQNIDPKSIEKARIESFECFD